MSTPIFDALISEYSGRNEDIETPTLAEHFWLLDWLHDLTTDRAQRDY